MFRFKGASGQVLNQVFPLSGRQVIGTDRDCHIHVAGAGIAPRHAEVTLGGDGEVSLRHLAAGYETLCNGEAVTETSLSAGDEVRIGTCRWVLQAPGRRPERVLDEAQARVRRPLLPWLLPASLALAALLAWRNGWLPF